MVGGTDGSSLARKGVCKRRLLQIISLTTQVAISRQVQRYKLALRDRQAARGKREEGGVKMPMTWGWKTLTRNRINEGYPRGGGVRSSLQEGKVGCLLLKNDRRETTVVLLHDVRFISD